MCVKSSASSTLIKREGLLGAMLRTLGSGVNKVSTLSKTALVDLCRSDEGLAAVFMDGTKLDVMTEVAARSDTAKFNVYEARFTLFYLREIGVFMGTHCKQAEYQPSFLCCMYMHAMLR